MHQNSQSYQLEGSFQISVSGNIEMFLSIFSENSVLLKRLKNQAQKLSQELNTLNLCYQQLPNDSKAIINVKLIYKLTSLKSRKARWLSY